MSSSRSSSPPRRLLQGAALVAGSALAYGTALRFCLGLRQSAELGETIRLLLALVVLAGGCLSGVLLLDVLERRRWPVVVPALTLVTYSFYEAAMPSSVNIRIDLALLLPAAALALLALPVRLWHWPRRER